MNRILLRNILLDVSEWHHESMSDSAAFMAVDLFRYNT